MIAGELEVQDFLLLVAQPIVLDVPVDVGEEALLEATFRLRVAGEEASQLQLRAVTDPIGEVAHQGSLASFDAVLEVVAVDLIQPLSGSREEGQGFVTIVGGGVPGRAQYEAYALPGVSVTELDATVRFRTAAVVGRPRADQAASDLDQLGVGEAGAAEGAETLDLLIREAGR